MPTRTATAPPSLDAVAAELREVMAVLRRLTRRRVRQRMGVAPLSPAEAEVLVTVHESPGVGIADVARLLALAPNTVSTLVRSLVAAGHLVREQDPADRRVAVLRLTPAGTRRVQRWRGEGGKVVAGALGALATTEQHDIAAALPALRRLADVLAGSAP